MKKSCHCFSFRNSRTLLVLLQQTSSHHNNFDCQSSPSSTLTSSSSLLRRPHLLFDAPTPTRRQSRQMEVKYGPLWRYMHLKEERSDGRSSSSRGQEHSSPRSSVAEVPIHSHTTPSNSRQRLHPTRDSVVENATSTTTTTTTTATTANAAEEAEQDPLLEFLERHEEDAEVLLAMWSSITRSCLYSSELSESVVLNVRYFFHTLLRHRAVAAAVQFYERLAQMGVNLPRSDVLLLLSNLPYEQSAAERARQHEWIRQDQQAAVEKATHEKRLKSITEEQKRYSERRRVERTTLSSSPGREPRSPSSAVPKAAAQEEATSSEFPILAGQPEWVRRWIMYEASMNNIDLEDAATSLSHPSADLFNAADTPHPVSQSPPLPPPQPPHSLQHSSINNSVEGVSGEEELSNSSSEANLLLEINTLVGHLNLLQVTSLHQPFRDGANRATGDTDAMPLLLVSPLSTSGTARKKQRTAVIRVRRDSLLTQRRSQYWIEALKLVERYATNAQHDSPLPLFMPKSLESSLHDLIRCSSPSWEVVGSMSTAAAALCYMKLRRDYFGAPGEADVTLWARLVLREGLPRIARNEALIQSMIVVPCSRFDRDSSPPCAIRAIWLVYLCFARSTASAGDFLDLFDSTQKAVPELSALHGDAVSLIRQSVVESRQSLSLLMIAVRRMNDRRAVALATAPSVRCGVYTAPGTATAASNGGGGNSAVVRHAAADVMVSSVATETTDYVEGSPLGLYSHYAGAKGLLHPHLLDVFVLNCTAVSRVCHMASFEDTAKDRVDPRWLSVVEQLVYGPNGIWSVFQRIYHVQGSAGASRKVESVEKNFVALSLAECLFHVVGTHCAKAEEVGANAATLGQVTLLLQLLAQTLEEASTHAHTLYEGEEVQLAVVEAELVKMCRQLLVFLNLFPLRERQMFGAVDTNVARCLSSLAFALVRFSQLAHSTFPPRTLMAGSATRSLSRSSLVWRGQHHRRRSRVGKHDGPHHHSILAQLSPRLRVALRLCFDKDTVLGRQVRVLLSASTVTALDRLLRTHSAPKKVSTLAPVSDADKVESGQDELRSAVYNAVVQSPDVVQRRKTVEALLATGTRTWVDALRVSQVVSRDVRITRGTLPVSFFENVLDTARRRLPANPNPSSPLPGVPASLWCAALTVAEAAIEHCGASKAAERQVLEEMMPSMLRWCMALGRRDVARGYRRLWASQYSAKEKRSEHYAMKNIEILSILREPAALQLCEALPPSAAPDALLLRVSQRHGNWKAALDAVFKRFGPIEDHTAQPYPREVAAAVLSIMCRCPQSLGRTGEKLKQVQGDEWDAEHTLLLTRILLKGRSWKRALQMVTQHIRAKEDKAEGAEGEEGAATEEAVAVSLLRAKIIVCGLQACAIGGVSDDAAELYERFHALADKALGVKTASHAKHRDPEAATTGKSTEDDSNDLLGAALSAPLALSFQQERGNDLDPEELQRLASQARAFYFRAMTKQLTKQSKPAK